MKLGLFTSTSAFLWASFAFAQAPARPLPPPEGRPAQPTLARPAQPSLVRPTVEVRGSTTVTVLSQRELNNDRMGNEGSGGGNVVAAQFVNIAATVADYLERNRRTFPEVDVRLYRQTVAGMRVFFTMEPLSEGVSLQAINDPATQTITVNHNAWNQATEIERRVLVGHEIFGLMGLERDSYSISSRLYRAEITVRARSTYERLESIPRFVDSRNRVFQTVDRAVANREQNQISDAEFEAIAYSILNFAGTVVSSVQADYYNGRLRSIFGRRTNDPVDLEAIKEAVQLHLAPALELLK
jgi:hypothetical protein